MFKWGRRRRKKRENRQKNMSKEREQNNSGEWTNPNGTTHRLGSCNAETKSMTGLAATKASEIIYSIAFPTLSSKDIMREYYKKKEARENYRFENKPSGFDEMYEWI